MSGTTAKLCYQVLVGLDKPRKGPLFGSCKTVLWNKQAYLPNFCHVARRVSKRKPEIRMWRWNPVGNVQKYASAVDGIVFAKASFIRKIGLVLA